MEGSGCACNENALFYEDANNSTAVFILSSFALFAEIQTAKIMPLKYEN